MKCPECLNTDEEQMQIDKVDCPCCKKLLRIAYCEKCAQRFVADADNEDNAELCEAD